MAPNGTRSRSTTSRSTTSFHRPKSRQSTTSIHSATGPAHSFQHAAEPIFPIQSQSQPTAFQATPEEMIKRSSHQLINPNNHFAIDPSLQNDAQNTQLSYNMEDQFVHTSTMEGLPAARHPSYEGREIQGNDVRVEDQEVEEGLGDGSRRKKGSASSQANDNELRRLFRENEGRDLNEIASQVLEKRSEKTKQIFGMLWLSANCKRSSGSVPRNRVFSHYATRCGNERVPPLNPASFGKLVRIIFPGISTRRLGVRGESKYHYVELVLNNQDQFEPLKAPRSQSVALDRPASVQNIERPTNWHRRPHLPADTALFPSPDSLPEASIPGSTSRQESNSSSVRIFMKSKPRGASYQPPMIYRTLQFPSPREYPPIHNGFLELPDIEPYLPEGADPDAVSSLTSVYRQHCLYTIDNFRYCKSNEFFESYKSLCGLLTVPGIKLLMHPKIARWIKECDWLKYQKMMPVLDGTVLSQVPPKVMNHMDLIRMQLCDRISEYFHTQPQHVQDAMLGPATIFTSLLQRMLRVHRSALDVASTLDDDANRDQLWNDWVCHVDPMSIVESSLTTNGHNRVLRILTQEVRDILGPLDGSVMIESGTIFDSRLPIFTNSMHSPPEVDTSNSFVDRLAQFLSSLPTRFPGVDARQLLNHIDIIGNNISRNFTLSGAASLASWWRIKMFVDEMSYWLAEKGGFLEFGASSMTAPNIHRPTMYGGGGGDYGFDGASEAFGHSRPRTAASAGIDRPSRFGSEDMGEDYGATDNQSHTTSINRTTEINNPRANSNTNGFHHRMNNESNTTQTFKLEDQHAHPQTHARRISTNIMTERHNSFDHDANLDHDDSGIAMGLDDDFGIEKYGGFVEGVHGSDPADVVVC